MMRFSRTSVYVYVSSPLAIVKFADLTVEPKRDLTFAARVAVALLPFSSIPVKL